MNGGPGSSHIHVSFVPQVALSTLHARDNGLTPRLIYNTSAYDSLASLKLMDGLVDIYLPDLWSGTLQPPNAC